MIAQLVPLTRLVFILALTMSTRLDITELLSNRCGHCDALLPSPSNLYLCTSGCRIQAYCSDAHQSLDHATHASTCRAIVDAQYKFSDSEAALRQSSPEIFETVYGRFFELQDQSIRGNAPRAPPRPYILMPHRPHRASSTLR